MIRKELEEMGKIKSTWWRTVIIKRELEEMGVTWSEAHAKAQDRLTCRGLIVTFCPSWDEEVE